MKELQFSKFWIFDLDNTLYSGKTRVFDQIDKRMSKYISGKLNVSIVEAKEIQKKIKKLRTGYNLRSTCKIEFIRNSS